MPAVRKQKLLQGVLDPTDGTELPEQLRKFAREVAREIAELDPSRSEELVSVCIGELALCAADERRRRERKERQMECIEAAKARGVRFGRRPEPLPDSFQECYQAWRDGECSLRAAASACGMTRATFQKAALRMEKLEDGDSA